MTKAIEVVEESEVPGAARRYRSNDGSYPVPRLTAACGRGGRNGGRLARFRHESREHLRPEFGRFGFADEPHGNEPLDHSQPLVPAQGPLRGIAALQAVPQVRADDQAGAATEIPVHD